MTDYKHPNMYSGHATLQEIARWGEDHTDEWVRKMAYLAHLVDVSLPKMLMLKNGLMNMLIPCTPQAAMPNGPKSEQ